MQQKGLQGNWAVVCAYRLAPKLDNGNLKNGEVRKLQDSFFKTRGQIKRIIRLVRSANQQGISLAVSDGRSLNPGRPSKLTENIVEAMKAINKDNLNRKIRTTRRRMQLALRKQGIKLPLSSVHRYILQLKGKLAKWHVKVYVNAQQMVARHSIKLEERPVRHYLTRWS